MNNREFSDSFTSLLNSHSIQAGFGEQSSINEIVLNEYEKSVLLTQAQDIVLKSYFDRNLNQQGQGFDDSTRRQVDFSTLIKICVLEPLEGKELLYDDRGILFKMPKRFINGVAQDDTTDVLFILNEKLIVDKIVSTGNKKMWVTTDGLHTYYEEPVVSVHDFANGWIINNEESNIYYSLPELSFNEGHEDYYMILDGVDQTHYTTMPEFEFHPEILEHWTINDDPTEYYIEPEVDEYVVSHEEFWTIEDSPERYYTEPEFSLVPKHWIINNDTNELYSDRPEVRQYTESVQTWFIEPEGQNYEVHENPVPKLHDFFLGYSIDYTDCTDSNGNPVVDDTVYTQSSFDSPEYSWGFVEAVPEHWNIEGSNYNFPYEIGYPDSGSTYELALYKTIYAYNINFSNDPFYHSNYFFSSGAPTNGNNINPTYDESYKPQIVLEAVNSLYYIEWVPDSVTANAPIRHYFIDNNYTIVDSDNNKVIQFQFDGSNISLYTLSATEYATINQETEQIQTNIKKVTVKSWNTGQTVTYPEVFAENFNISISNKGQNKWVIINSSTRDVFQDPDITSHGTTPTISHSPEVLGYFFLMNNAENASNYQYNHFTHAQMIGSGNGGNWNNQTIMTLAPSLVSVVKWSLEGTDKVFDSTYNTEYGTPSTIDNRSYRPAVTSSSEVTNLYAVDFYDPDTDVQTGNSITGLASAPSVDVHNEAYWETKANDIHYMLSDYPEEPSTTYHESTQGHWEVIVGDTVIPVYTDSETEPQINHFAYSHSYYSTNVNNKQYPKRYDVQFFPEEESLWSVHVDNELVGTFYSQPTITSWHSDDPDLYYYTVNDDPTHYIDKPTFNVIEEVKPSKMTEEYVIVPMSYREYDREMSKPYSQPLKKQAWRLFQNTSLGFDFNSELIPRFNIKKHVSDENQPGYTEGDVLLTYKMRYIRRPRPIILEDLPDGLEIDGETMESSCELNPIVHMDILNKAVELALVTRGRMQPQQQNERRQ